MTEIALPTVEHARIGKWDPFLQNEPESIDGVFALVVDEAFTVSAGIESRDESALESARGELAEILAEDSAMDAVETGFESENSGVEFGSEGIDGGSNSEAGEGSDGGENE